MKALLTITVCLCLIAAITPAVSAGWIQPTYGETWAYTEVLNRSYALDGNDLTGWQAQYSGETNTAFNYKNPLNKTISAIKILKGGGLYQSGTYTVKVKCILNDAGGGYYVQTTPIDVSTLGTEYTIVFNNGTCGGKLAPTSSGSEIIGITFPTGTWPVMNETEYYEGNYTADIELKVNFNATPTEGILPLFVAFQDNSTGGVGSKTYNWTVDPPNGLVGNDTTSEYPTIVFTQEGNYSITHCATDSSGQSGCKTETDYIHVYLSNATVSTTFWVVDVFGHTVYDSSVFINDVENASWQNTTSPSTGVVEIVSLIGHTLNGYAEAIGYNDGEALGIIADGTNGGVILMTSTNITNVSAGYVTLYVYVEEPTSHTPIPGAYVNLAYAEGGSTRNDGSTTSTEGFCSFVVPNNTLIYIYGEKAGYIPTSSTKESGTGSGGDASVSAILYMNQQTVTPTVTATTGPGGTVPVTVDPRTPQEKESDIALILIDYGDMLVMFFIALTVIGGVKMIMK